MHYTCHNNRLSRIHGLCAMDSGMSQTPISKGATGARQLQGKYYVILRNKKTLAH